MMKDYEERSYYDIQLTKKQIIVFLIAQLAILSLSFFLGLMICKSSKQTNIVHSSLNEKKEVSELPPKEIKPFEEKQIPPPKKEYEFYSLKESSQTKGKEEDEKKPSIISPTAKQEKSETSQTAINQNYYALQLYALKEKKSALEKEKILKEKGYSVSIIFSKGLYKIRVGKFSTKEEALKFKEAFEKKEKITSTMIVPY